MRCLLYGQKRLMGRFDPGGESYLPSLLLRLPPLPCPNDLECLDGMIQWIHGFSNALPGFVFKGFDPLRWLMDARDGLAASSEDFMACDDCRGRMCGVFNAERARIWDNLTEFFALVSVSCVFHRVCMAPLLICIPFLFEEQPQRSASLSSNL